MKAPNQARSKRADLRMTPGAKRTLERAARVANKTLTEFLLDAGLKAAADTLAGRRVFQLNKKQWDAFMAALAAPPKGNPRLRKLLARKPPWGRSPEEESVLVYDHVGGDLHIDREPGEDDETYKRRFALYKSLFARG